MGRFALALLMIRRKLQIHPHRGARSETAREPNPEGAAKSPPLAGGRESERAALLAALFSESFKDSDGGQGGEPHLARTGILNEDATHSI